MEAVLVHCRLINVVIASERVSDYVSMVTL